MTPRKRPEASLEISLKRLEAIVNSLETGEVPLERAIELYEEGIRISQECTERLKATELRIKKLAKDVDGKLGLSDAEDQ